MQSIRHPTDVANEENYFIPYLYCRPKYGFIVSPLVIVHFPFSCKDLAFQVVLPVAISFILVLATTLYAFRDRIPPLATRVRRLWASRRVGVASGAAAQRTSFVTAVR